MSGIRAHAAAECVGVARCEDVVRVTLPKSSAARAHLNHPFRATVRIIYPLPAARNFYGKILGCEEGRSSRTWIDYNLFGHQIVSS